MLSLIILVGSLALLMVGAWCVSEGGEILGEKYDATIVGGFIIAWLNTAPETIFFVTALELNNPTFAVGALSGSIIVVSTVAVGACLWIGANARLCRSVYVLRGVQRQAQFLFGTLLSVALLNFVGFSWWMGCLGIAQYIGFVVYSLADSTGRHEDKDPEDPEEDADDDGEGEHPTWKGFGYLLVGGGLIYTCSEPFINAVVAVGTDMQVNPILLAFFIAPIASEAPEILESITLARRGKTQSINIAYSNLIGGTISKTTLLLGILSFYSSSRDFQWVSPDYTLSFSLVIVCTGTAALLGALRRELPARAGKLLIVIFSVCAFIQYLYHGTMDDELIAWLLADGSATR